MKFATFIHNDGTNYFHVAIQGTHKLRVMGHINFEGHVLIKRWQANEKMNVTNGIFKEEKKWGNCKKQLAFVARSCAHFQSFGIHSNMSAESAIEKL
jgi:hypothetical protein